MTNLDFGAGVVDIRWLATSSERVEKLLPTFDGRLDMIWKYF